MNFLTFLIFLVWTIVHIYFMELNSILKNADSFAYLQMADWVKNLSSEAFGTWWFWFLYSLPIWSLDNFIWNDFLSAQIINIILFIFSAIILYKIGRIYLKKKYNLLLISLFFLSSSLIHFNINILSENIYIPLFLLLFYSLIKFYKSPGFWKSILIAFLLALLYFSRWEAFIYILPIIAFFFYLGFIKKIKISKSILYSITIVLSFWIFIFPYLSHMHSISWEWWLTNKWWSNIRMAKMRDISFRDNTGFEKAVWELTDDKKHLKIWFVWGLEYDKPSENWSTKDLLFENPEETINRLLYNQKKLYTYNMPHMILGSTYESAFTKWYFINKQGLKNHFLILSFFILLLIIWWFIKAFKNKKSEISIISLLLFLLASSFFTIFFVHNRYFIVFLPIAYIFMLYGLQSIKFKSKKKESLKFSLVSIIILSISISGLFYYYDSKKKEDNFYELKKEAWLWIKDKYLEDRIRIMERIPIVTYYSDSKKRYITPYTYDLKDLHTYARHKKVNLLVVDTMDFKSYRPMLDSLLNTDINHPGLKKEKIFEKKGQKVIIYSVKKDFN